MKFALELKRELEPEPELRAESVKFTFNFQHHQKTGRDTVQGRLPLKQTVSFSFLVQKLHNSLIPVNFNELPVFYN